MGKILHDILSLVNFTYDLIAQGLFNIMASTNSSVY